MRNPLGIFKSIKPVKMDPPAPMIRFGGYPQQQQPEKPWPIWQFVVYIAFLFILWLVAYPIIDTLYDNLIEPLDIPGYLDFGFKSLPYILFLGLTWIGFRKTFRREGE